VAFAVTVVLAPVLALVPGGLSELSKFIRDVFDARSQHLISDSVWGAPALNFSHSGLAHPVLVSAPLQVVVTIVLIAWVLALVALTLRTAGSGFAGVLAFWNVAFSVVLLLPVSHLAYTIIGLPILWSWIGLLMAQWRPQGQWRRADGIVMAATAVLVLWWIVLNKTWPDNGSSVAISSLRYSVVFVADLIACSASVFGLRWLARAAPAVADQPA
jgi:hypothetical protein